MFHIQELCDTAIWIDKGKIKEMGDSDKVVGHYEDFCNNKKSYNTIRTTCLKSWNRPSRKGRPDPGLPDQFTRGERQRRQGA